MTDEPLKPGEGDENLPDSTEEYLLGGIDEDLRPEPDPKPPVEEPPAEDPPPPSGPARSGRSSAGRSAATSRMR